MCIWRTVLVSQSPYRRASLHGLRLAPTHRGVGFIELAQAGLVADSQCFCGQLQISACDLVFAPRIDRGPLEPVDCERAVQEILRTMGREYPNRRVVSIAFLNEEGHATVRLDDAIDIGWGERL